MRSFFQKKLWVVLLAVLALASLTVLAVSLDEISFEAARPLGQRPATDPSSIPFANLAETWLAIPLGNILLFWGLVVLMVILIGLLLTPEMRKRMILLIIRTGFTVYMIYFLLTNYSDRLLAFQSPEGNGGLVGGVANSQPFPEFEPPQISPLFSYLVSFAFALLLIGVMWGLYRMWNKYIGFNTRNPLNEIAHIARSSLNDLSSGRDSSDVIINCYLRMSDVVADKRKLHRDAAMTPQEFAARLERAGLPGDAVRRLTGLFEVVRYGDRKSGPKDVTEAVNCLNTILHYCGEAV